MPDAIETAKTGRANCRGCGRAIARGELRFGEALPNAYGEGEAMYWFHLLCAAFTRPEKFGPALEADARPDAPPVPEPERLRQAIEVGLANPRLQRLVRAERAASGSAHCRECKELVGKGSWRIALQVFEAGRMQPIGTIHAQCAGAYFGTAEIMGCVAGMTEGLTQDELTEIERCVRGQ